MIEFTTLPLAALQPNKGQIPGLPTNPRQWTKEDIDKIAKSLKETPELFEARPIIVYPYGGKYVILGGNLRYEGSRRNLDPLDEVPVAILPEDTTVEKMQEIVIKDNGSFGSWDYDTLANEWDVPLLEWGVPAWNILEAKEDQSAEDPVHNDVVDDDFDEDAEDIESRVKKGQLWQLGRHRLYCGDSSRMDDLSVLFGGKEARLCVTSPPYGIGKEYEKAGIEPWKKNIYGVIDAITKFSRIIVWNIGDLFATGTQFIEPTSMYSTIRMAENGFPLMYIRIWKKQGGNFAGTNPYYTVSMKPVQEYEWLLCYGKGDYEKDYYPLIDYLSNEAAIAGLNNAILKEVTGAGFMFGHWFTRHQWAMIDEDNYCKIQQYCREHSIDAFKEDYSVLRRRYENLNIYGKLLSKEDESDWGQWGIWTINTVSNREDGHPAAFPVELPARFIKMHSRVDDIVFDPFGGSGTTMIAAEQLGRVAYLMEIDPHYCDIIISRWEKYTGQKAELVTTNNTPMDK